MQPGSPFMQFPYLYFQIDKKKITLQTSHTKPQNLEKNHTNLISLPAHVYALVDNNLRFVINAYQVIKINMHLLMTLNFLGLIQFQFS